MQKNSPKWQRLKSIDFYFITDSGLSKKGILDDVREAIKAGCKIIQYREKNNPNSNEALKLKKLCDKGNVIFLINDDVELAVSVGADGVHLGQEDMKYRSARKLLRNKIIGLTVHNEKEAVKAEKIGADYIGLSPIFKTSTKKDAGKPCGISMIRKVRKKTNLPIVAIGGITKQNISKVIMAGADSAVAISAVLKADVKKEVEDFIRIIKENRL
ncbi:thiamine phosphate synthase [Candidatus Woesearchaeota archaeon]|nr:thiamine phosphate synthase [Candidatus Woesearchaeota archaeon]